MQNNFQDNSDRINRKIYTVSELTAEIKALLENKYPFIWISGEISNLKIPASGHFYFTLKDENAQIHSVMFRAQNRKLKFELEEGLEIIGLARINVYEPRGSYQLLFEFIEPKGIGALQYAFEQLKARLSKEGLFDEKHKRNLPFLPYRISLITSPAGAVVHDMINIINRRFNNIIIEILPIRVQGEGSAKDIVLAFKTLNERAVTDNKTDVIILARGGGSIEDLASFNAEEVARAIFASKAPVVSAVGHETDFTISDFVADQRAPTPSAAAELVVPNRNDLKIKCNDVKRSLIYTFYNNIKHIRNYLNSVSARLVDPRKMIHDLRLKIDDCLYRINREFNNKVFQKRDKISWLNKRLYVNNPKIYIKNINIKLEKIDDNLSNYIKIYINNRRYIIKELTSRLKALSPAAILERGYSITRTIPPDSVVIRNSEEVNTGQKIEILLSKGSLICKVERKYGYDKNKADI